MKDRCRREIAAGIASHSEIDGHLGWRLRQSGQVSAVHAYGESPFQWIRTARERGGDIQTVHSANEGEKSSGQEPLELARGDSRPELADTQVDLLVHWIDTVSGVELEARVQCEVLAKDEQMLNVEVLERGKRLCDQLGILGFPDRAQGRTGRSSPSRREG